MKAAPLELEMYHVTRFSFEVQKEFRPVDEVWRPVDPEHLKVEVRAQSHCEEPLRCRVILFLTLDKTASGRYPYDFTLEMMGYFAISSEFPEEERGKLVRINAPSLLYSAAREFLAATTGRGPYPELCLPSITFNTAPIVPAKASRAPRKHTKKIVGG